MTNTRPATAADRYTVEDRPAQPYVYTSHRVAMADLAELANEIPRVLGTATDHGLTIVDPPLWRYRVIDMARLLTVEVGVPIDGTPTSPLPPGTEVGELPAGRYATVVHVGTMDSLEQATADLLAWAAEQGLAFDVDDGPDGEVWGSRFESYRTDPREEPDMSRWETELAFRLADGTA